MTGGNDMCKTYNIDKIFNKIQPNACVNTHDKMFAKTAECSGITRKPVYYASLSYDAMLDLQNNYKPNLIYKWPKCINRRNEKGERVLKLDRMPFGLLKYQTPCKYVNQRISVCGWTP